MNAQEAALWSCQRQVIDLAVIDEIAHGWRVTLKLSCGHSVQQDFKYPSFHAGNLRASARQIEEVKARRWMTAARAAKRWPCLACGPSTDPARVTSTP